MLRWPMSFINTRMLAPLLLKDVAKVLRPLITVDNERETVYRETCLFLQQQINAASESPAFNLPPIILPELRRLLRQG